LQLFTQPYAIQTAPYIARRHTGYVENNTSTLTRHLPEKEEFTMKTKTSISRLLAISALALGISMAVPVTAFAGNRDQCGRGAADRGAMEMHHGRGIPDLRGIDLSAAQVAQLSSLREEQRKIFREKGPALREQRDALHKLVMSDAYTPAAAAQLIAKIDTAQGEMGKLHAEQANKLYTLLTPEQRTRLQQNELMGHRPMGRGDRG
jgi:Spy/CpxP family protein refolding chaperone